MRAPRPNDFPRLGVLGAVLTPGSRGNRQILAGLITIAVLVMVYADLRYVLHAWRFGVDLEIPLRAVERWLSGGEPYLAESFAALPGPTQPFLYPPYVLPVLSPLTGLPRLAVQTVWVGLCLVAALFAMRRLAIPPLAWPLVLAWSPMLEGVFGGNVQVPVFACFVALFWQPAAAAPFAPVERDIAEPAEPEVKLGLLATIIGAIKVSQPHAWLYVLRRRPRGAVAGAAIVALVALATVPLTGLGLWVDWLEQLRRATDPTWELGGIAIARLIDPVLGFVIAAAGAVLAFVWAPRRHAGAWVGLVSVVAASSLHTFGMLFLVPAMLLIRREVALLAAILIATTTYQGTWAAIGLVTLGMVAMGRPGWVPPPGSPESAAAR
jgi:hypothetical protein